MIIKDGVKKRLRKTAITGARFYNHYFLNKSFVVVTEGYEKHIVTFLKKDYIHLTGLNTNLSDERFFDMCVNGTIAWSNIKSYQIHDYSTLKKKSRMLEKLHFIIHADASTNLFLTELVTPTITFPVAIRNDTKNITLAFKGKDNHARSLRKAINSKKSKTAKRIIAIFEKGEDEAYATKIVYISDALGVSECFTELSTEVSMGVIERLKKLKME